MLLTEIGDIMNRRNFLGLSGTTALVSAVGLPVLAQAKTHAKASSMPEEALQIQWLGGATMLISFDGVTFLTDPAFGIGEQAIVMPNPNEMFDLAKGPNIKPQPRFGTLPAFDLGAVTATLISHSHPDHFDAAAQAKIASDMPMIATEHDKQVLAKKGFSNISTLPWGKQVVFPTKSGQITITAVPAEHSENAEILKVLGPGNGYFFEFVAGEYRRTMYWTGDTFPVDGVVDEVQALGSIDVLVPHVGGVGATGALGKISMDAADVVKMVDRLRPKRILPIHHSTFGLFLEPIWKLVQAMERHEVDLDVISEGGIVQY
ncbi:L-ascorbate metabolism protein UlaG, beta-lactamase superfamily [Pseudovibrio ascidiaceicola]|uniref:L-ascorbate metabolism protein UlaG, beta-lactamase superfamily n=2 Tax=Pseudovibrio ascidiaceicola TaxID=285279 RepID=A0A1I4EK69_9HYPH|nr:L-ascorbate metabolism protein UlaG, beta-lactamase superfamily [Pseudovibrio ascidiaceicola]